MVKVLVRFDLNAVVIQVGLERSKFTFDREA